MSEMDTEGATRIVIATDQEGVQSIADGVKVGGAGNSFTLELAPQPPPRERWQPGLSMSVRLLWSILITMALVAGLMMAAR